MPQIESPIKPQVAMDETGHTGANLLDAEQPAFVLASLNLSDVDADSLVGTVGPELKFAKLKRSAAGRQRIINILNSPLLNDQHTLTMGIHKPFMITAKIVDLLVEPLAHDQGIDLYQRGANLALANMFHFCMPVFLGADVWEQLRVSFVTMVRDPSPSSITAFYTFLEGVYSKHRNKSYAGDLAILLASRPVAEDHADVWGDSTLDPSIPAFVTHATNWTQRLRQSFKIVHDQSKPLANLQAILEAMMSTTEESVQIGYDRRKTMFPIMAEGIDFGDSSLIPQLRVADLLAGAAGYCLRAGIQGARDRFVDALLETRALDVPYLPVWPEPKVTPEELGTTEVGGVDAIDFTAKYVTARLGSLLPLLKTRKS